MALIRALSGSSGGGGTDPNLVTVYEKGTWGSGFSQSTFNYRNATHNADNISFGGSEGDGLYSQTDYTSTYKGVRIVFTTTNTNSSRLAQFGINTTSASLPSIISSGTGRVSSGTTRPVYPEEQTVGITLSAGNGFYIGCDSGFPMSIIGIYFVKN